jgi:tRNA G26 N,N-dimethylase Trm1
MKCLAREEDLMESVKPECSKCGIKDRVCVLPEGRGPAFCPALHQKEVLEKANQEYGKRETLKFAHEASVQEAECYVNRDVKSYVLHPTKPRVPIMPGCSEKVFENEALPPNGRDRSTELTALSVSKGFSVR